MKLKQYLLRMFSLCNQNVMFYNQKTGVFTNTSLKDISFTTLSKKKTFCGQTITFNNRKKVFKCPSVFMKEKEGQISG